MAEPTGEPLLPASQVREIITRANTRAHALLLLNGAIAQADLTITQWVDESEVEELRAIAATSLWAREELVGLMDSLDEEVSRIEIHRALMTLYQRLENPTNEET